MILKLMTKDIEPGEVKTVYQYVLDLRERLEETMKVAQEELKKAQGRHKNNFDKRAKVRNLKVGDKVLVHLQTNTNKLLMQDWRGGFQVDDG